MNRLPLTTIFVTVLLDVIGVGIATPTITPLLLRPDSGLLPPGYPVDERTVILGFLLASFSIAGFFGGPLLGALSDRYGRKPMLIFSLCLTLAGYLIFALGIQQRNLSLLFLSRIVYGLGGGNIAIIQSAIADVSDPASRIKNFGLVGVAFGLGFIIGPTLGGELANPKTVAWFNFTTPFYAAALLAILNLLMVLVAFRETLAAPLIRPITPLTGFRNIAEAFGNARLRLLFVGVFFYALGFNFYTQFFSVYLLKRFDFDQVQIGRYFGFVGICIALMQGLVVRRVASQYTPQQIVRVSVLGLAIALWCFLLPQQAWQVFLVAPLMALFQGLTSPNATALVSASAGAGEQGKILGINQSVLSASFALPPIIAGYIETIDLRLPLVLAGFMALLGWIFLVRFINKGESTA
ncbi:Major facilitator superfamily domain-containing protein 10 Tetracycline transporter-like protein [Fibrella aestuarina BUZ 2]|uniref:Major facilitator superfamily domain-containing protein 10 Tetracycline transporter-like protein n=1 Tax=Fibrella aestuarina BUZ 2 TaxID=1166018 RepID=I0K814_9BACT|nr:MFS transporter [Fibrella aestuarina]CCH00267.1 Major facilitator superfamily domain-containing protein 10 Tetracycline transporter-like protein [Fibrella aestuarina BUZ 2]